MSKKPRRKRRRRTPRAESAPQTEQPVTGGGLMQSMRSGMRQVAGVEQSSAQTSRWSNVVTGVLLLAAAGLLLYRLTQ